MKASKSFMNSAVVRIPLNVRADCVEDRTEVELVIDCDCFGLTSLKNSFTLKTIVDIGAGVGAFASYARLLWPGALVYCYESNAELLGLLKLNAPFAECFSKGQTYERNLPASAESSDAEVMPGDRTGVLRGNASTITHSEPVNTPDPEVIDLLKIHCRDSALNGEMDVARYFIARAKRVVIMLPLDADIAAFTQSITAAAPEHQFTTDVRHRMYLVTGKRKPRRLEIGSGWRPRLGFEHLDADPSCPNLDYVCSMDSIPVGEDTFDEVWSTHVIEHVPLEVARKSFKEWFRVLKPGGFCHVDTPNLLRNVSLYLTGGWEQDFAVLNPEEQRLVSLNGVPNKTLWLNFKVFSAGNQWNIHYTNYDGSLLSALMHEAGFTRVEEIQTEPSLIVRGWKPAQ